MQLLMESIKYIILRIIFLYLVWLKQCVRGRHRIPKLAMRPDTAPRSHWRYEPERQNYSSAGLMTQQDIAFWKNNFCLFIIITKIYIYTNTHTYIRVTYIVTFIKFQWISLVIHKGQKLTKRTSLRRAKCFTTTGRNWRPSSPFRRLGGRKKTTKVPWLIFKYL